MPRASRSDLEPYFYTTFEDNPPPRQTETEERRSSLIDRSQLEMQAPLTLRFSNSKRIISIHLLDAWAMPTGKISKKPVTRCRILRKRLMSTHLIRTERRQISWISTLERTSESYYTSVSLNLTYFKKLIFLVANINPRGDPLRHLSQNTDIR